MAEEGRRTLYQVRLPSFRATGAEGAVADGSGFSCKKGSLAYNLTLLWPRSVEILSERGMK